MEDGEGPREKEVTECGETEPALHDGESAGLDLRAKSVGHSLGLREWGQGRESRAEEELPSGFLREDYPARSHWGRKGGLCWWQKEGERGREGQ